MAGIGDFNFLGSYQENTETISATGGRTDVFAETSTAWGKLSRSSGSRSTTGQLEVQSSWVWECYMSSLITPAINNRWVINGMNFTIQDYEIIGQKKVFYRFKLLAVE